MTDETKIETDPTPKRGRPRKQSAMAEVIDKADARSAADIFAQYPPESKVSIYLKDTDKKNKYLGSTKVAEVLEVGGFEDYLSETYGGGSYAVTVRNERGQAMRNLTFEVMGPRTPLLLSLIDGDKPLISSPSVTKQPDKLMQLESELEEFKRQKERDDLMSAFQSQLEDLKKDLRPRTDWAQVISAAGSTLGAIIPLLRSSKDTDNPVILKLLEDKLSGADVVRSVKAFMDAVKDLQPPLPPPPVASGTSASTNSIIDTLVQALAPSILAAVNKGQTPPTPQNLPAPPPPAPQPQPQSQTHLALEQLRQMISSRTNPQIVAEAMVESFGVVQREGVEQFPELLNLQSNPDESLKRFFNRIGDFSSLQAETYRDEIVRALFGILSIPTE